MKNAIDKVTMVLTAAQARALQEHLKATVKPSFTGQTDLEKAHTALVDALCRARAKADKKGEG